ncbi:hypothetical protein BTUL_0238g00020 [Botrytis tulipae]|uniref:Uncharacterized protein n=1 Tax=Botrytis tulipae TaxID=87230 RepID=A0A4Z1E952_9HELO|nr:hypothetical protein BTUL_0238g00020 [Botrytis tulipae]
MSLEPGAMDYERMISALDASIAATPHQAPPPPQRTIFTKFHDSLAFFFPIFAPVFGIFKAMSMYLLKNLLHPFKVDAKFMIIIIIFLNLLLLYIFWGLVQAFCMLLITIMTTTTSAVSTIGSVGTCVAGPISYLFETTDTTTAPRTKQNGHDQTPITNPSIIDLILSTSHIQTALSIISDRNDLTLNDQTITFLLPTLKTLQTNVLRLREIYSNFRSNWAQKLSHVALQSQGIAGRVLALEKEWEAILDESNGFGEWIPDSDSALRQVYKHQDTQKSSWFRSKNPATQYSTFEHLARAKYQQILIARRDHAILMKNLSRDSKEDSIEMTRLLSDIEKEVGILDTLADLAKEEKKGMESGRRKNWNEQEKAILNDFGWTTWTAVWTAEEREDRATEMDTIEGLMKDVVHIQDLTDLIKSIRAMIDKDEIIWRELLEGSEKFLNLQGFAKEGRDWDIGDGSMIFVKRKTEELYGDMGDQKKRACGGKWGKWLGKSNGGKEDEKDEKEKSGQRILELRQWCKDVREWASLRQDSSRSLKNFVENR